ncbi:MAG: EMC3/TMCO1 family protein [Candidatus Diapherotrites archaeon]|nr:EMC3/TMCO1 family protein [Candidatus Diapherotrites archaeon]
MVFMDPLIEVAIIALALVAFSTVIRNRFMDKEAERQVQEKQKEWKVLLKNTDKESMKRLEAVQKEMLDAQYKMMRSSMPPMLIMLAVFFLLLPVMNSTYAGIEFPPAPYVVLPGQSWIWYYFVIGIVFSIALTFGKKIFKKSEAKTE